MGVEEVVPFLTSGVFLPPHFTSQRTNQNPPSFLSDRKERRRERERVAVIRKQS